MAASEKPTPAAPRRGRKRDPGRDRAILDAALDVLAEEGFDGMTMDLVAARAKAGKGTVYRRWASKSDLLNDAIDRLAGDGPSLEDLPDTGSLRGDLLALRRRGAGAEQDRKLKVVGALSAAMFNDADLARRVHEAIVGPWTQVNRLLIGRAVDRGEIPETTEVDALAGVLPSMISFHTIVERQPLVDEDPYIEMLIDTVLLPAIWGAGHGR